MNKSDAVPLPSSLPCDKSVLTPLQNAGGSLRLKDSPYNKKNPHFLYCHIGQYLTSLTFKETCIFTHVLGARESKGPDQ